MVLTILTILACLTVGGERTPPMPASHAAAAKASPPFVDMDGLILTETGGKTNAIGDQGRSLGLCQMSAAAWADVEAWTKDRSTPYRSFCFDSVVNRRRAHQYINEVLPQKYLRAWAIPDTVEIRLAMYKYGPGAFRALWQKHQTNWQQYTSVHVRRDLEKYQAFVQRKKGATP